MESTAPGCAAWAQDLPESRPQRSVPLRQRQEIQEMLWRVAEKIRLSEFKAAPRLRSPLFDGDLDPAIIDVLVKLRFGFKPI
ncbi:hypothetical protein MTBLM1_70062 [Rhodospirillaceae bacterium LM-1]|nr:hypothetical protein MTBLM1_70062 [Rhodospirillaceae bacterium LM-1]